MKKRIVLCILFVLILTLVSCTAVTGTPEALIDKVRQDIPIAEAETADIAFAGLCERDGDALLWYISGNEHQAHTYFPIWAKALGNGQYEYLRDCNPMKRGEDIAVLQWKGGYAFCINNPNCKTIRITDADGTKKISVEETLPFVYFSSLLPTEYVFLDEEGHTLS